MIFAVAAGVAWLWQQEAGRRQLAEQVDGLKSRLASLDEPAGQRPDGRSGHSTGLERQPVDWAAIASELKKSGVIAGGLLNKNARLLAEIEGKSVEELLAMLDQVAAADLSKADRDALEKALATALAKKDPEAALSRFTVPGKRGDWDYFLAAIYRDWVKQDNAAAIAWLRKHVAAGRDVHREMISTPFFELLRTAPETSSEILASLPPEIRLESIGSLAVGDLKQSGQKEWAGIVRSVIPEADRLKAISWPIMNWCDGDGAPMRLDEVDDYLKTIGASVEERDACVMMVAETLQLEAGEEREGLDRMRAWVAERAPGLLEPATLRALEELAKNGSGFSVASERALQFHAEGGNDAYLSHVLDHADDNSDPATVRKMIEHLSDPALQAKYREMHETMLE